MRLKLRRRGSALRAPVIFTVLAALLAALFVLNTLPAAAQTATPTPAGCPTPLDLRAGQRVYTRPGVYLRNLPTLSGGIVNYYQSSVTLRITGTPVCADGQNWWPVNAPDNPGWVSEGRPDFYLIFVFAEDLPEPCPTPLALGAGTRARVLTGLQVRETPAVGARVLTVMPSDALIDITGPVSCIDGVNWWPVRVPFQLSSVLIDGWVAEGQFGQLYLTLDLFNQPTATPQPCAPPYRRLEIGIRAVITYRGDDPKNLRAAPGLNAPILYHLLEEVAVDILDGPACVDGLNWWQVQVAGRPDAIGWVAEGGTAAGGYWLIPLGLDQPRLGSGG